MSLYKALCECGRVALFSTYVEAGGAYCSGCGEGGEDHRGSGFCPCESCVATISQLEQGQLSDLIALHAGVVLQSWSPTGGYVFKE